MVTPFEGDAPSSNHKRRGQGRWEAGDFLVPTQHLARENGRAQLEEAGYLRVAKQHVEIINYALRGLPSDKIRYHVCWGSWHGPHSTDIELKDVVHVLNKVAAGCFVIEAANARHEHEWMVWKDVPLPDDKILAAGVVSHATDTLEHPDLVAWRLKNFASAVGRERVIASTDCGLGYRVHPTMAWAKLQSLVEGARRASAQLW